METAKTNANRKWISQRVGNADRIHRNGAGTRFNGSRVQRFKGSRVQGSAVHGSRVHGSTVQPFSGSRFGMRKNMKIEGFFLQPLNA
jgi:hypothetical protein